MTTEEYFEIRESAKHLAEQIFKWGREKFNYLSEGNKLGLISNGIIMIDDDADASNLQDFMLYNAKFKGTPILDLFYDSDIELDDTEELILEGMVNSEISIFEIIDIDSDDQRCRVILKDLIKPGIYEVINQGFAQTATIGAILCNRLIAIEDQLYMMSGSTFAFDSINKDKLLADYSFEKFKHRKKFTAEDLFIFCYKKHKAYGKEVKYLDHNEH